MNQLQTPSSRLGSLLIVPAVLALALSCGSPEPEETPAVAEAAPAEELMEQLKARDWKLVAIGGTGVESGLAEDVEVTLVFTADGRVAGSGGCNRYFSAVEFGEPGVLSLGPVGSTMMACPQQLMNQEQQYLRALQVVEGYQLTGDQLELLFGVDGFLTYEATELPES